MREKYYNLKKNKFYCKKAYEHYVKKTGTERPFEMTNEQIVVFSVLCYLKRNANVISITRANIMKNRYLKERYNGSVAMNLLNL